MRIKLLDNNQTDGSTLCLNCTDISDVLKQQGSIEGRKIDGTNTPIIVKAPNGTALNIIKIPVHDYDMPSVQAQLSFSHLHRESVGADGDVWTVGRAGMRYRDLVENLLLLTFT